MCKISAQFDRFSQELSDKRPDILTDFRVYSLFEYTKTALVQVIFSKTKIFRKFDRRRPQVLFTKGDPQGEYRSPVLQVNFRNIFVLLQITWASAVFYTGHEYRIYFSFELQIFSLNCHENSKVEENIRKTTKFSLLSLKIERARRRFS